MSRSEQGSVSVLLAASILVVLVLIVGVADLARVLAARSAARTAADAGALAAAQEMAFPAGFDPAAVAQDYVEANDASLVSCACEAGATEAVVEVTMSVDVVLVPAPVTVVARARAVVDVPSMEPIAR